jgi:hypothetical protein
MRYERAAMNVCYSAVGNDNPSAVPLAGAEGELLTVSIVAEPRDLEYLLDRLGQSQYPIDPQIYHDAHVEGRAVALVEFPAYDGWLDEIGRLMEGHEAVTIRKCLTHAASN